ncbi:DUF4397 domain-containing protein [Mucilaginibacter sp. FT3.2]|uniref:DUF4397 domain-containing protein n=1 Tax=Mucilaginibacter sp. FT3.2 TaxID=2723090 RepID=UPI001612A67F|nr:DUF4397 domain-containing protein [Mucilaginibacter sp. FT3.2]MBB6235071.1 hypothetical protein [Mucilaginibacter sp. FT3.2]
MNTRIKALFFVAAAVICWASCKKSNDDPAATSSLSVVGFFNLSSNDVNFYVNGTRINNTTTYYPGGTLGYLNVIAGAQNYSIKIDGSTTPFFEKSLTFATDSGYSLYVSGKTANDIFYSKDLWVPDTGTNLTKYAQIRYVNASSTSGNMSFVLRGTTDSAQFSNVAYKTTTNFTRVNAGIHYIGVYRAAYPTVPKIDTVTITAGKIYTFYGYGTPVSGNLDILAGLFNNG